MRQTGIRKATGSIAANGNDEASFPIPPWEQSIPIVRADLFCDIPLEHDVPLGSNILEGLCFLHSGNLLVCNTPMGRIYLVDMDRRSTSLWCQLPNGLTPSAAKLHRDGRVFVTCITPGSGSLVAVLSPEGELVECFAQTNEHMYDDMVFDRDGGFYLSDLGGSIAQPTSGIWYVAPGSHDPEPVIGGMVMTNGIALTPEENALWVTEYGTGRLHWINLEHHHVASFAGSHIVYRFCGLEGPDSACIDADGNLYVALCGQGRFMALDRNGIPVRQYLLPGRERGRMLKSTHPQIRPGTNELYLCSADLSTGEAAVFVAPALAHAHHGFAWAGQESTK